MTAPIRFARRRRRGFALASALAVVLLFAFATTFVFMIIHEGDRRVERFRANRNALNLAESAVATMVRRFQVAGEIGLLTGTDLNGGTLSGEMKLLTGENYQIRAVGDVPIVGGQSARTVIIVDGIGTPGVSWSSRQWRYARAEER